MMLERNNRRAFSLAEMLVVLAIVGVLLAFSAPMWMAQSTVDLNGASLRLAGFFEEARSEAVAWGEPVRVLVHDDVSQPDRFRRRVIAIRREKGLDDDEATAPWTPVLHPLILPAGVFFDSGQPGSTDRTMTWADSGTGKLSWLYYEISPSGAPADAPRNVVLGKGIHEGTSRQIRFPNPEQVAGFRLTNRSRPLHFRSRDDIRNSID